MPRAITERLMGYNLQLHTETAKLPVAEVTADGGEPTVSLQDVELTILTFFDDTSGHRIEVPFMDENKQQLVKALTGGIEIATRVPRPL